MTEAVYCGDRFHCCTSGFLKLQKFVNLLSDVVFVNGKLLLNTMPRGINFVNINHIPTFKAKQLIKSLKRVMIIYSRSSMIVKNILVDMDFEKTVDKLMEILF